MILQIERKFEKRPPTPLTPTAKLEYTPSTERRPRPFLTRPHPTTSGWGRRSQQLSETNRNDAADDRVEGGEGLMWIMFFIGLGVVVMAILTVSVLSIMRKEGEAQEAEQAAKQAAN